MYRMSFFLSLRAFRGPVMHNESFDNLLNLLTPLSRTAAAPAAEAPVVCVHQHHDQRGAPLEYPIRYRSELRYAYTKFRNSARHAPVAMAHSADKPDGGAVCPPFFPSRNTSHILIHTSHKLCRHESWKPIPEGGCAHTSDATPIHSHMALRPLSPLLLCPPLPLTVQNQILSSRHINTRTLHGSQPCAHHT
jgi:hypothetical protein